MVIKNIGVVKNIANNLKNYLNCSHNKYITLYKINGEKMGNKCRVKGCDNIKVQENQKYIGYEWLEKYCFKHYNAFYFQEVLPKDEM